MQESDLDLAKLAAAGDSIAQQRFVARLIPQVRRTMSFMTNDTMLAEDFAQIALIKILYSAGTYRQECSLEFWASRISSRMALNELKKISRRAQLFKAIPRNSIQQDPGSVADEIATKRRLSAILSKLSPKYRIALILKYIEGFSANEIGQIVDAPVSTVRKRLMIGKKKLRHLIARDQDLVNRVQRRR